MPEPLGVTLVIGAWNYPYQLFLLSTLTAIVAGNTVMIKPSELPMRASNVLVELLNSIFPKDFICGRGGSRRNYTVVKSTV
ncbi:aldehyde dehydrogenase family protein [Myroides sp. LoEW2-1]|nr:aldehyde dehydrogenase family protein [Myroides sp. LoEW2-1]